VDKIQTIGDFVLNLLGRAEDVRVVLFEAPHARQTRQRATGLVAAHNSTQISKIK
jgi:hypothetical protein